MAEYYNWQKIMSAMSDKELLKIVFNRRDHSKMKYDAALKEAKTRRILKLDPDGKFIYRKVSPEVLHEAAKFHARESVEEVINFLNGKGMNEENAKKVSSELKIWYKKAARDRDIGYALAIMFLVAMVFVAFMFGLVLLPGVLLVLIFIFLTTATSPKNFQRKGFYEILE